MDPDGNLATETVRGNNQVGRTVTATASKIPDVLVDRLTMLPVAIEADTPVRCRCEWPMMGRRRRRWWLVVLRVNGRVVDSIVLTLNAKEETGVEFDSQVLGAGSHSIEVVVDPDGALTSETVRGIIGWGRR